MRLQSVIGKSAFTVKNGEYTLLFSQSELIAVKSSSKLYVLDPLLKSASLKHLSMFNREKLDPIPTKGTWFDQIYIVLPIKN